MNPIQLQEVDKALQLLIGENKLTIHNGDILELTADALVCPVGPSLDITAGLANEINKATGHRIHVERSLTPEPFGKVLVLPGGKLKFKYVFIVNVF